MSRTPIHQRQAIIDALDLLERTTTDGHISAKAIADLTRVRERDDRPATSRRAIGSVLAGMARDGWVAYYEPPRPAPRRWGYHSDPPPRLWATTHRGRDLGGTNDPLHALQAAERMLLTLVQGRTDGSLRAEWWVEAREVLEKTGSLP